MGKQVYTMYTKKAYLAQMEKNIPDDLIIVTSNVLDSAEVVKKKGSIKVSNLHAQEFFDTRDNIRFIFSECIPISTLLCKKSCISKEYIEKLKKDKGVTGFSIQNPF